jgi:hypothetical protein
MKLKLQFLLLCAAAAALPAAGAGSPTTVTGWVLDSACAYTKALAKPISSECAIKCAKQGSPLVILTDDGSIYLPVADTMPAKGQNARLLPFAGKRVTVTGNAYERSGSHAIVIEKIDPAS